VAASVVNGKSLSMVKGVQGASQADVVSAFASSRSSMRVYTAATSKASWRWGIFGLGVRGLRTSGGGRVRRIRPAEDLALHLYFFIA
jgi:hypothetical protein